MQITDLAAWVRGLDEPSVAPLLATLAHTLDSFVEIGLGYLSLDRPSGTLSGGEAQRVKMIRHLGSSLTDVTYVFDEPTIGLHPHDIQRMNALLLQLRDKGNTVLVVEHKPETIAIADHVVDLGPGAGTGGGTICFAGSFEGLRASGTLTGRHLDDRAALKKKVRTPTGKLKIRGATTHNLRNVDVDIPLGVLVVITGVAGSGKSSLVHGSIPASEGVVSVDQGAIHGSRRSNPATYTGLLDPIRKAFAKANGVKPALFSANSEGACPNCNGAGVIYTDLAMMAGVATTCEECEGKRFQAAVLEHRFGGRNISEVLAMSVTEARQFFGAGEAHTPAAHAILERLADVGLGYISLGQPLTTLSGGERSGSSWPPTWPRRAASTSSTSRPPASTSPTSRSCSACSTGSSTPASRSSSSSTTRPSWPTPTGSSTSAPAPATTAAGRLRGHARRPRRRPLHPHRRAPRGLRRRLNCGSPSRHTRRRSDAHRTIRTS
jgi:excinuclease UvrABC ATPase subunit